MLAQSLRKRLDIVVTTKHEAFIYLWYDAPNKMYYLGKHKGTPDDGYTHSSTIWESFTMDNIPKGARRRILAYGTDKEICLLEHELLKNRKKRCWDRYYNNSLGDPRYVVLSGENNPNYKHGELIGCQNDKAVLAKYFQKNYQKNKEVIKTVQKEHYQKNKAKILAYQAEHYQMNKALKRAQQAEYYQKNKEVIKAKKAEHYQKNRAKRLAYQAEYRQKKKLTKKADEKA